jgi:polyvinyl alcohol dehydrogenase (cytochrome)
MLRAVTVTRSAAALLAILVTTAWTAPSGQAQSPPAPSPEAAAFYDRSCASCHNGGNDRAPSREALRGMTPERILAAMETGPMIMMAINRPATERRGLAEFLSGKPFGNPLVTTPSPQAMCRTADAFDATRGPQWSGWGHDLSNTRLQDAASAGITAANVARLKVKWAFAFPGDLQAYAHPTLAGGRLFTGSWGGKVYALDAATGCVHWYFTADANVRSAIALGAVGRDPRSGPADRTLAFFGDLAANVYAVDAKSGELAWKTKVDRFPVARVNGSPVFYRGRVYAVVASGEEGSASVPTYECCKFRGSVVALDAATGAQIWKTYVVDEPKPTTKNAIGTQLWGPSGVPIWSTPAIDPVRNAIYVTTGNNYSDPTSPMSDAFVSMDLETGRVQWVKQMTANDAYTSACRLADRTNCAASNGPDYDFAASPILTTLPNGRRLLLAGQKSAVVHALDPDKNGEIVWQVTIGRGGTAGGVQWGSAVDRDNIYVALADVKRIALTYSPMTDADPKEGGGMFALRLRDGSRAWYTPPAPCGTRQRCSPAQSAAVTAVPGVAFSGSVDGHMRAYAMADGRVLWDFDTIREYQTVNGVPGRGGSIDGPGPVIAGGMLFMNSGYPTNGGTPGNVLIALSVDGK